MRFENIEFTGEDLLLFKNKTERLMFVPISKCHIFQEPNGTLADLMIETIIKGPQIYSKCIQPLDLQANQVPKQDDLKCSVKNYE